MNLAANTVQAASTVRADVKDQVTEGVSALGQFNDFLVDYAPDIIAASSSSSSAAISPEL